MEETRSPLAGRRYVCLARCSTNQQEEKSIPDQLQVLHDFAGKHGMTHAGDDEKFHLGGISGSHPAARTDIDEIIKRKRLDDDFSVLLVQDLSRLTRGGVEHGGKLEYDLAAAGIKVVFAGAHLPEGDHAGIVKSVEYYSAQQHAKSVSFGVARGQMSAILAGKQTHCLVPAYGIDRLYITADGKPSCIIRNLPDGRQLRLNPETRAVEQVYPKSIKGQPRIRYGKQAGEKIVLIPGDPEIIAIIRQMFRWTLVDGWGDWRVAKALNDLGIPSSRGKTWKRNNVKVILRNPIYVGRGIGNRRTSARYNKRSRNAPTKVPYELTEVASRRKPRTQRRPRSEWIEQEHELLKGFLGEDLHDLAVAQQDKFFAATVRPAARKDKHADSKYILKGILRSKQGGHPMTGTTQGPKDKPYRYYCISSACATPSSDASLRRLIRAEPVEAAVLAAVRDALLQPGLREQVTAHIEKQSSALAANADDLQQLKQEQSQVNEQIEFVIDELGSIGKDAAKKKIQQLENRLASLDDRIGKIAAAKPISDDQKNKMADEIVGKIAAMAERFDDLPPHALRELVASIVVKLEVNLETRALTMELAPPIAAAVAYGSSLGGLCVGDRPLLKDGVETQRENMRISSVFDCERQGRSGYDCRRRAA